ncbi:hypothetical protein LCGC14_3111880, partial [marine sediment metagenome]
HPGEYLGVDTVVHTGKPVGFNSFGIVLRQL